MTRSMSLQASGASSKSRSLSAHSTRLPSRVFCRNALAGVQIGHADGRDHAGRWGRPGWPSRVSWGHPIGRFLFDPLIIRPRELLSVQVVQFHIQYAVRICIHKRRDFIPLAVMKIDHVPVGTSVSVLICDVEKGKPVQNDIRVSRLNGVEILISPSHKKELLRITRPRMNLIRPCSYFSGVLGIAKPVGHFASICGGTATRSEQYCYEYCQLLHHFTCPQFN